MMIPKLYNRSGIEIQLKHVALAYRQCPAGGIQYLQEEAGLGLQEAKDTFELAQSLLIAEPDEGALDNQEVASANLDLHQIALTYENEKILGIKYLREQTG